MATRSAMTSPCSPSISERRRGRRRAAAFALLAALAAGCAPATAEVMTRGEFARVEAATAQARRAAQPLPPNATLDDLLAFAALNNPGLEAAFQRWKAAVEMVPQATALPDPMLRYEVEVRRSPREQEVRLMQTFPWFGKLRLKGEVAAAEAEMLRRRFEAEKLALFRRVKDAYAEYYYVERGVAVMQANVELMTYLESVARTRYAAGAAEHPDVIKAQVELAKVEDALRTMRAMRPPTLARLNAALGRRADAPLPPPAALPEEVPPADAAALVRLMNEKNPELAGMAAEVEKARRAVELAGREFYPDIGLGATYLLMGSGGGMEENGKDGLMLMAEANLPIWRGKVRAGVREAEARLHAATQSRADLRNRLASEVQMALFGAQDAQRKVGLYRDALIPKGRQQLQVAEAAYRAGRAAFLDLIDSQQALLEFELSYERALADRMKRLAELDALVGREVPPNQGATAPSRRPADDEGSRP